MAALDARRRSGPARRLSSTLHPWRQRLDQRRGRWPVLQRDAMLAPSNERGRWHARAAGRDGLHRGAGEADHRPAAGSGTDREPVAAEDRTAADPLGRGPRGRAPAPYRQADRDRARRRSVAGAAPDDRGPAALARAGREARAQGRPCRLRFSGRHAGADRVRPEEAGIAARGGGRGRPCGARSGRARGAGCRSRRVSRGAARRESYAQAGADRSAPAQRHRQRLLGRDPARGAPVAARDDPHADGRRGRAPVPDHPCHAPRMDRSPARGGGRGFSREGHRLPRPTWRCTASTRSPARCAARRSSASVTPTTRPTTARAARPTASFWRIAPSRACSARIFRAPSRSSSAWAGPEALRLGRRA